MEGMQRRCLLGSLLLSVETARHVECCIIQAIKDSREREQLFNDHMKERDRKEKEQRRAEVKKRKAAFRALLEATKSIKVGTLHIAKTPMYDIKVAISKRVALAKVDSPWRKVQGRLEGEDEYESVEKLDRLEVFQEYIWYALASSVGYTVCLLHLPLSFQDWRAAVNLRLGMQGLGKEGKVTEREGKRTETETRAAKP